MKKAMLYITLVLLFVLQSTVNRYIDIMHIFPNFVLVFTVCYSLKSEPLKAGILGFLAGMLTDISLGRLMGLNTLLFLYTAIAVSCYGFNYLKDNIFTSAVCVFAVTFIFETVYGLLNYVLFDTASLKEIILNVVVFEAIYNMLVSFLMYGFTGWLAREQVRSF